MSNNRTLIEKLNKLETINLRDVMDTDIVNLADGLSDTEKEKNFKKQLDEEWVLKEDVRKLFDEKAK